MSIKKNVKEELIEYQEELNKYNFVSEMEKGYLNKVVENTLFVLEHLSKENQPHNMRGEEWGEIILEYRYDNMYCEVIISQSDNIYFYKRPIRGIISDLVFDMDSISYLDEEIEKCRKC